MNTACQCVIFSDEAYNAVMTETFKKDPYETGGILLGHMLDNGIWIVMEVLPPGWRSIFQYAYFEYDEQFVNYVAQNESKKYEIELQLLGLWHRHPGSMDTFSGTDDATNRIFAELHPSGAISGLVNIDPRFRLTMYHVKSPLRYNKVDVEVGNDLIPEKYFKMKYYDEEKELNPYPPQKKNNSTSTENQSENKFAFYQINQKNNNRVKNIISNFTLKYIYVLLFIITTLFSGFTYYSYNKLKISDDIKVLYHIYYQEFAPNLPSTDSIIAKANSDFEKEAPKVDLKKDSFYNVNLEKRIEEILIKRDNNEIFREKDTEETDQKYNKEKLEHTKIVQSIKDSITKDYDSILIQAELVKLKDKFIKEKENIFLDNFKKTHKLTPDFARKGLKTTIVLLFATSLLSFILILLPRKHKPNTEWIIMSVALIVASLLSALFYTLSPMFFIVLFTVFAFICFVALVLMFFLKSSKLKNIKKVKPLKIGFWYQRAPKLYIEEETEIRKRFPDAEKNVENGIVSFFIKEYKVSSSDENEFSFQLVYSADYLVQRKIKIYLISPDLDELLGDNLKNFPCVSIDGAGECYLNFMETISKDKVSGVTVIEKFNEWLRKYKEWKINSSNIDEIKLRNL